jgi:hypothetical protein
MPGSRAGALFAQAFQHPEDRAELAVIDSDDDRAAGVRACRLRPAASDVREVLDVESDHDALLVGSQGQERLIGPAVKLALLAGSADIVAIGAQGFRDSGSGKMGVEQEAQRALRPIGRMNADEGVFGLELGKGTAIERDCLLDLLGKALLVGERKTDRPLAQVALGDHCLNRVEVTTGVDDLPDIQRRPDHPGAAIEVLSSEGDAGEHPRPQRLLGKALDYGSLAAVGASRLGGDHLLGSGGDSNAERF